MKDSKLKAWIGTLSLLLLFSLIIKLRYVPGGMFLSGSFLGGMVIAGILIVCLILAAVLKTLLKNYSFLTLYSIATAISFLVFHYILYSPILRITVPKGFSGEVTFFLSNVKDNILTVDSNGIGYLNQWTFKKTYAQPTVVEPDGNIINQRCVGFNLSTFWGSGAGCCIDGKQYKTLSFKIAPEKNKAEKQYISITDLVDRKLLLLLDSDEPSSIQTVPSRN